MTRRAHPSGSAYFRPAGSLLTPAEVAELLRRECAGELLPSVPARVSPGVYLLTPRRELTAAERAAHAELLRQFRELLEPFRAPSLTA